MPVTTATHKRRAILSLLFVTVATDCLDRSNLFIAGSAMAGSLHLSTLQMGLIFSGFGCSYVSVLGLRLLIGLFEAPSYPLDNRVFATWFPEREREHARSVSLTTSGQFAGLAFLTPALAWLQTHHGRGSVFVVSDGSARFSRPSSA